MSRFEVGTDKEPMYEDNDKTDNGCYDDQGNEEDSVKTVVYYDGLGDILMIIYVVSLLLSSERLFYIVLLVAGPQALCMGKGFCKESERHPY